MLLKSKATCISNYFHACCHMTPVNKTTSYYIQYSSHHTHDPKKTTYMSYCPIYIYIAIGSLFSVRKSLPQSYQQSNKHYKFAVSVPSLPTILRRIFLLHNLVINSLSSSLFGPKQSENPLSIPLPQLHRSSPSTIISNWYLVIN